MGADYLHAAIAVKTGGLFDRARKGSDDELESSAAALTLANLTTEPCWATGDMNDYAYEMYYEALGAKDSGPDTGEEAQKLWDDATAEQRIAACKTLIDLALYRADDINGRQAISWEIAPGWTVYESGGVSWGDWPTEPSEAMYAVLELPTPVLYAVGVTLAPNFDPQEVDTLAAAVQDDTIDIDTLRAAATAVITRIHPQLHINS
jgi:hypothetical protein